MAQYGRILDLETYGSPDHVQAVTECVRDYLPHGLKWLSKGKCPRLLKFAYRVDRWVPPTFAGYDSGVVVQVMQNRAGVMIIIDVLEVKQQPHTKNTLNPLDF